MAAAHANRLQHRRNRNLIQAQQTERGIDKDGPHDSGKASASPLPGKGKYNVISGFRQNVL